MNPNPLTQQSTAFPAANLVTAMTADVEWLGLPLDERERLRIWVAAFASVAKPGITRQLQSLAVSLDRAYPTVRKNFSAWQKSGKDWRVLVDGRKTQEAAGNRTGNREFGQFFKLLCEQNQRSTSAAIRKLKRMWKSKEHIPGYEGFPGWPTVPPGWSEKNLRHYAPTQSNLTLARQGKKAAKKHLPQYFRTRVGLWPGSHIQMDDVWHDNFVRYGDDVTRVLEFGALDVWSACRFAWGSKPRMPKGKNNRAGIDGKHQGLKDREFRLFVASVLWNYGYSAQGTTLMMEHAAASLSDDVIGLLSDSTGGLLQCDQGGMTGEQQAVLGLWGGRNGGHGNFKSHLESLHSLMHTELAALPGQTGKRWDEAPESTYGIVRYQEALIKWARNLPTEIQADLQHPLLDYQTEFVPFRDYVYDTCINGRTDHDLEGWAKLKRIVTEYTLNPGSEEWLAIDTLPEVSRGMILAAAKAEPQVWSQRRALSSGEVWAGRSGMIPANAAIIADIIGHDEGKVRKVKGSYFRFEDSNIDTDELIYESRITRLDGKEAELNDGENYGTLVNPYSPEMLIVLDARERFLGTASRVHRGRIGDIEARNEIFGRNKMREAEILQPMRERWETDEREAIDLREHNAALGFRGSKKRDGTHRPDSGVREANKLDKAGENRLPAAVETTATEAWDDDSDCPYL